MKQKIIKSLTKNSEIFFFLLFVIIFGFTLNANAQSNYWKNYFSSEERKAVQKNAEKYTISEIESKSEKWKGIIRGYNIKNGSIDDDDIKENGIGTDKISGLGDYVDRKISGSSTPQTPQDFSADNLTGTYAALDGSQITGITANQINAIPYSGATSNVDLGSKNITTTGIGNFGNIKTSMVFPGSDSISAFQINKADGMSNVLNVDTTNGRVGIGTTTPSSSLYVNGSGPTGRLHVHNDDNTTTGGSGIYVYKYGHPSSANAGAYMGIYSQAYYTSQYYNSSQTVGLYAKGSAYSNGKVNQVMGVQAVADYEGNNSVNAEMTSLYGGFFKSTITGTGQIDHVIGAKIEKPNINGVAGQNFGLYVANQIPSGAGVTGGTAAVFIEGSGSENSIAFSGSNSSAIYSKIYSNTTNTMNIEASSGLALNSVGGNVGIGTTDPKTKLEVDGIIKTKERSSATCNVDAKGGIYFDSDDNHFYGCNGTVWVQLDN